MAVKNRYLHVVEADNAFQIHSILNVLHVNLSHDGFIDNSLKQVLILPQPCYCFIGVPVHSSQVLQTLVLHVVQHPQTVLDGVDLTSLLSYLRLLVEVKFCLKRKAIAIPHCPPISSPLDFRPE